MFLNMKKHMYDNSVNKESATVPSARSGVPQGSCSPERQGARRFLRARTLGFPGALARYRALSRALGVCRVGPRGPKTGQEDPKRPPKTALEALGTTQERSKTPKMTPRRPQRPPRRPKRPPRGLRRGPRKAKIIHFTMVLAKFQDFFVFGFPTFQDGPGRPQ